MFHRKIIYVMKVTVFIMAHRRQLLINYFFITLSWQQKISINTECLKKATLSIMNCLSAVLILILIRRLFRKYVHREFKYLKLSFLKLRYTFVGFLFV